MRSATKLLSLLTILLAFTVGARAQTDEICGESGSSPWLNTSFVFGRITLNGFDKQKPPKVTVVLNDRRGSESRYTIDRSGNYCFRDVDGGGGFIVIEVEGTEITRRSLPQGAGSRSQFREDFEILASHPSAARPPGTISARYNHPRSDKNTDLLEKAAAAERSQDPGKAVQLLREVVADDPSDFIAWARLGSIYFEQGKFSEAESSYLKSIAAKADYAPAMINLGKTYLVRQSFEPAIDVLEKATRINPPVARAFQLLGEAYLLARKGTLGVAALNEAIRLDPIGMAESHLLMARLYDLAGAKPLASREYRLFLEKVPDHRDKKKFVRYIKDHPEEANQD